jgi:hypothetical protein
MHSYDSISKSILLNAIVSVQHGEVVRWWRAKSGESQPTCRIGTQTKVTSCGQLLSQPVELFFDPSFQLCPTHLKIVEQDRCFITKSGCTFSIPSFLDPTACRLWSRSRFAVPYQKVWLILLQFASKIEANHIINCNLLRNNHAIMKVFALALSAFLASSNVHQVTSSKIVNTCKLVDKKQPTGPYTGETKAAHAHLMFRDMDQKVLDVLKSFNNTKATFVIHSDKITDETLPLLQNIVADGHTIASNGQSSNPQINFLYANETLIEQQIMGADEDFKKAIGYAPNLYMPSFGAMDTRAHHILDAHDKQTILWSAGSNGWWFIGNNEPIETTVAALRYTMPEMGGIIMMPPDSAVLEEYLTQVWPYW